MVNNKLQKMINFLIGCIVFIMVIGYVGSYENNAIQTIEFLLSLSKVILTSAIGWLLLTVMNYKLTEFVLNKF